MGKGNWPKGQKNSTQKGSGKNKWSSRAEEEDWYDQKVPAAAAPKASARSSFAQRIVAKQAKGVIKPKGKGKDAHKGKSENKGEKEKKTEDKGKGKGKEEAKSLSAPHLTPTLLPVPGKMGLYLSTLPLFYGIAQMQRAALQGSKRSERSVLSAFMLTCIDFTSHGVQAAHMMKDVHVVVGLGITPQDSAMNLNVASKLNRLRHTNMAPILMTTMGEVIAHDGYPTTSIYSPTFRPVATGAPTALPFDMLDRDSRSGIWMLRQQYPVICRYLGFNLIPAIWMFILVARSYNYNFDDMTLALSDYFFRNRPVVAAAAVAEDLVAVPPVAAVAAVVGVAERHNFVDDIRRLLRPIRDAYNDSLTVAQQLMYNRILGHTPAGGVRQGITWTDLHDYLQTADGWCFGILAWPDFSANFDSMFMADIMNHGIRQVSAENMNATLHSYNLVNIRDITASSASLRGNTAFEVCVLNETPEAQTNLQVLCKTNCRYNWAAAGIAPAAFWVGNALLDFSRYQTVASTVAMGEVQAGCYVDMISFWTREGLRIAGLANTELYDKA